MDSKETTPTKCTLTLVAGAVDYGTRSITAVLERYLEPCETLKVGGGARALGIMGLLHLRRKLAEFDRPNGILLCAFHAPVLAGAFLSARRKGRLFAINAWTAGHPSLRRGLGMSLYNHLYAHVPRRFDRYFSHSESFREFHKKLGAAKIEPFLVPLPCQPPQLAEREPTAPLRVLYIGADFKRKGGDLLLDAWGQAAPADAKLTFVCPNPPRSDVRGVTFLRNIRSGTPEHRHVLENHDVFVLPTFRDEYGYAALEALTFGQVVVTTLAAGVCTVVKEAGGIVSCSPAEAVAAVLELCNKKELIGQKRAALPRYLANYTNRLKSQRFDILQHACPVK
jgi:hypothetical protein